MAISNLAFALVPFCAVKTLFTFTTRKCLMHLHGDEKHTHEKKGNKSVKEQERVIEGIGGVGEFQEARGGDAGVGRL